jgi:site-specific recombinase XerD
VSEQNSAIWKELVVLENGDGEGTVITGELVTPSAGGGLSVWREASSFPIVQRAGRAAVFAADEFFFGTIRNEHTRRAYLHAVRQFLNWAEGRGLELAGIAPRDIGQYLDSLGSSTGIATRKQHLSALRHFFDGMVTRHAIILNPALSVRAERYSVIEGKTPEITVAHARTLLASIDTTDVVGKRDRALLAVLIYTASRAGAVAALKRGNFYRAGEQYMLHFREKGGKSREIPVRHDLQEMIFAYFDAAGLRDAPKDTALFQSAVRKEKRLSGKVIHVNDVCRMMKRRLKDAALPEQLSPHSFRVTTITDLLEQGVPLEDVQRLAGHADPRTTRLYDRRDRKITRNVVERISV